MACACDATTFAVDLFRFIGRESTSPSIFLIDESLECEALLPESGILCGGHPMWL
jgi:hypothetical protein